MNTSANSKYKILVVDDDLDLNTTFALLLEFDGHEVQTAGSGEAALNLLAKSQFDLMIAEYWLPQMKGNQLAKLVKEQWPDLPVILATANTEELNIDEHPITGADCLLDKPFSMNQLRDAMTWALNRHAEKRRGSLETHWMHGGQLEVPDRPPSAPGDSSAADPGGVKSSSVPWGFT